MHDPWKTPRFYKRHLLHTKAWANKGRTKQTQNTENIKCKGTHVWPDLWQKSQLGLLFMGSVKARGGKRRSTIIFNILKARDRTLLFQVIGITKATNRSRGPLGPPYRTTSTQLSLWAIHSTFHAGSASASSSRFADGKTISMGDHLFFLINTCVTLTKCQALF